MDQALAEPEPPSLRRGKANPEVIAVFKKHCQTLGVRFSEDMLDDIIKLLATVKAQLSDNS